MRKIFFWLHLTVGSIAGVVILLMSVTGVLLTYEKQMTALGGSGLQGRAAVLAEVDRKSAGERVQRKGDYDTL